jgi:hypothetical protein
MDSDFEYQSPNLKSVDARKASTTENSQFLLLSYLQLGIRKYISHMTNLKHWQRSANLWRRSLKKLHFESPGVFKPIIRDSKGTSKSKLVDG